jgi:tetratricopeptide (TPR) repeat protein
VTQTKNTISTIENGKGVNDHEKPSPINLVNYLENHNCVLDANTWFWLGLYLVKWLGAIENAEEAFCQALKLNPELQHAWINLGLIHDELGRNDEAERCLRKAVNVDTEYYDGFLQLGYYMWKVKKCPEEAITIFNLALGTAEGFDFYASGFSSGLCADMVEINLELGRPLDATHIYLEQMFLLGDTYWPELKDIVDKYPQTKRKIEDSIINGIIRNSHAVNELVEWALSIMKEAGWFVLAEACYRKALELEPENCLVWLLLEKLLDTDPVFSKEALEARDKASGYVVHKIELLHDELSYGVN